MKVNESENLDDQELFQLIERVFGLLKSDRGIAILMDLPGGTREDSESWRDRRAMARDWYERLSDQQEALSLPIGLFSYANVQANNADLPTVMTCCSEPEEVEVSTESVFRKHNIVLAMTELSATAPLKVAAPRFDLRAATMPGFLRGMIPALRVDYLEVDRRCQLLAKLLTQATQAEVSFFADGQAFSLLLDLRFRTGHSSGGLLRTPGTAGNVPSGEAYIVPYEGEQPNHPSLSQGVVPVEFDHGIAYYRVEGNRAVEVIGDSQAADQERQRLASEPAYGNLAELGLGVLGDFGIDPIGAVLLDEKLGPHIAFGRSDHFGGQVGPEDFSAPDQVVHIDRVYLPQTQPAVQLDSLTLQTPENSVPLIVGCRWIFDFDTTP